MDEAPKDRPILAWCEHASDPYFLDEPSGNLTTYGAHAEGMGHAEDGWQIIEWGGEYHDVGFSDEPYCIPEWWFVTGSNFEVVASPVEWWPLPERKP